jgi:hypothetical protein
MRIAVSTLLISTTLIGCAATVPNDREGRLLTMAAAEAQQISDATQRLNRQLNFASMQAHRGQSADAKQSLAYAAQTLRDAKPGELHSQIRIAGWVSISELSRGGNDKATAQMACGQAVAVLRSLETVSERPEYVVGVAEEVEALQGKPAAAKLLEESAAWIKEIKSAPLQQRALVAICKAIFEDDDLDGGLKVLRTDPDAAWRSDTLAMLAEETRFEPVSITQTAVADNTSFRDANGNVVPNSRGSRSLDWVSNVGNAALPGSLTASPDSPTTPSADAPFGKPVDFRSVFQQSQSK